MRLSRVVSDILKKYEGETPGVKAKLVTLLTQGRLKNTGHMVIYPVDQGFEHGPVRSFGDHVDAYDPHYHFQLAIDGGMDAFAAPLGMLEAGADTFAGRLPLILKMNSANSLTHPAGEYDQAITGTIDDALRLGSTAVGFTIYPGSPVTYDMYEEIRELASHAKTVGLPVVIWSYPRGSVSVAGETALDIVAYGAHMACLLGAHIIKVKLPTAHVESPEAAKIYKTQGLKIESLTERVRHVINCCFSGRRLVVFSGGATKDANGVYDDARAIRDGGGCGSIIGRNCFQRPRLEALAMIENLMKIYQHKA